ncbi:MAG: SPFH domain-containing protein [Clostridiales bacterium]|nr:SPFH domain-containing protein [Clostridiales bacterium]
MAVLSVIKFEGLSTREWIIYRHFNEKITSSSQLIVGEGQLAILVKGGTVCDIFQPGTYKLDTRNIPILHNLVNLPYGGNTPYTVEVYFVNTTVKMNLYWGTSDPIQLIDPKYHIRLRIRAFGQYGMRIIDSRTFFTELVGSLGPTAINYDKVVEYFKGILVTKIKSIIAGIILDNNISALEIAPRLETISEQVYEKINPEFSKYGISIVNFNITSINFPEKDFEQINQILHDKAEFEIMGDSRYSTKRSFDVYEGAATNEGGAAGALASGGVGLGVGMAMANSAPVMAQPNVAPTEKVIICQKCGESSPSGAKFCNGCGSSLVPAKKVCPNCSCEVAGGAKFCNNCGSTINAPATKKCSGCGAELKDKTRFCNNCGKPVE